MALEHDPFMAVETSEGDVISRADQLALDGELLSEDGQQSGANQDDLKQMVSAADRVMAVSTGEIKQPQLSEEEIIRQYDSMLDKAEELRDKGLNPTIADPDGSIARRYNALMASREKAQENDNAQAARQAIEAMKKANQDRALARIRATTSARDLAKAEDEFFARQRAHEERRNRLA